MKHIERQWRDYFRLIGLHGASDVQIRETRRAFYAGAAFLLRTMMARFDGGTEPTEADLKMMNEIDEELTEWADQLAQGVA